VHSSGGELTPEKLVADAHAFGLDFLVATEHNTAKSHEQWRCLDAEDLRIVLGQEVVTRAGHWLALGIGSGQLVGWDYGSDESAAAALERQVDGVRRAGGVCVAAHPHAPYPSGAFSYPYSGFDVVEVWNGRWTSGLWWQADNEAALAEWGRGLAAEVRAGRWRPAMGNSDTHLSGQIGIPHTVVAADDLTADALVAGIGAGRSWIAESTAVELDFTASACGRRAGIGERLEAGGGSTVVRMGLRGVPSGVVTIHTDEGVAHRYGLPGTGSGAMAWQWRTAAGGRGEAGFVRVEVRHPDGRMAALSNPIILA
jgi:hypothetical protein